MQSLLLWGLWMNGNDGTGTEIEGSRRQDRDPGTCLMNFRLIPETLMTTVDGSLRQITDMYGGPP